MPLLLALLLLSLQSAATPGGYARPELLVDTAWLATRTADANLRIVDLRPRGYAEGHIPNAVWLDNNWIRNPKAPPDFLPAPADFEALMAKLGIGPDTRVVAYDERGGIYAARLWWILNYYGHADVALLNGGWTKWTLEARATSTDLPALAASTPFRVKTRRTGHATARDVLAAISTPGVKIVDARSQGEIDGKDFRGIKRAGFIESSVPVYWEDTFDPKTHAFKPAAEIATLYRDKGILPSDEIIAYCQVGMRASHDLFTLALIGHDLARLRNYYGAWEEWGNREDTPIKTKP
ncbi:MAG: sulfurtransferase [Acidobacteria bacterium]|nr:sulfurtransferase [Acidobacteriota bacterium]